MSKKRNKRNKLRPIERKNTASEPFIFSKDGNLFAYSEFTITYDVIQDDDETYPMDIDDEMLELFYMIQENPREAIVRLENLKEKYPNVPRIYNYLCVAHSSLGNRDKTMEIAQENYTKNPRYLFAKVNYADICLQNGEMDKIPEIFENKFDLKLLYPKRDVFHITEVMGFYGTLGVYWNEIGNREIAQNHYDIIKELEPDHPITKRLGQALNPTLLQNLLTSIVKKLEKRKKSGEKQQ